MLADNGLTYFEYHYAVPWAGGAIVPINTRLADPELGAILCDCGASMVIGENGDRFIFRVTYGKTQDRFIFMVEARRPT